MLYDSYTGYMRQNASMAVALVNSLTPGEDRGAQLVLPQDPQARRARALARLPVSADHPMINDELDDVEVDELYRLAAQLRPVFAAGSIAAAAPLVARLLAAYRAAPELVFEQHDQRWRLHFHPPFAGIAAARGAGCATAFAFMIEHRQLDRIGVCNADKCDRVFFDSSKNGRKRFCSQACLNRTKTAQFRRRSLEVADAEA